MKDIEIIRFINSQIGSYDDLYEQKLIHIDEVLGTEYEKRHRHDMEFYKQRAMLFRKIKENFAKAEILEKTVEILKEKFDLSLENKELHFDHSNYEWREINDGYSEEHFYKLTDEENAYLKRTIGEK